jgi:hypothetical protein
MAKKRKRRKRRPPPPVQQATEPATPPRRAKVDGPPAPPWGSFPLTELVILLGIVLLFAGYFVDPPRGTVMLGTGLTLAALGGLELSVREHFAGYRSHTLLLAGAVGVATVAVLVIVAKVKPAIAVPCGAAAFLPAAWALGVAFRRRSGGSLYRFR